MAWATVLIGLVLIIAGFRGEIDRLQTVIKSDLTGQPNFLVWLVAVFAIGAMGAIKPLRPVSDGFFVLIIVVLILSNRGFFAKFTEQVRS